jgi:membrane protein required for beta-lactamase induction
MVRQSFVTRIVRWLQWCNVLTSTVQYGTVAIVYLLFKAGVMAKGRRGGAREGAGRKPLGEATKVATLVRLSPDVRKRLEHDAKQAKRRSLSEHIERELTDALRAAPAADKQTKALCYLISQLAKIGQTMERATGAPDFSWRTSRFDFEAFRSAIIQVLDRLAPTGEAEASRYPMVQTPEDMGRLIASTVFALLTSDEAAMLARATSRERGSLYYAFPQAARELGLSGEKK